MVTREPAPLITEELGLDAVWPEVSRALRGYLRARGSSPQDAEDVLQECALRVLNSRPTFVDAPDLIRWCIPVVRNLAVDLYRRDRHETLVDRIPDEPGRGDLADDVSHSLELGRVLRALQQLRPSDRDAIVAHLQRDGDDGLDRKTAVRLNVQRHRARQRLLARLAAVVGVCWGAVRRGVRVAAPAMLPAALALGVAAGPLAGLHSGRAALTPHRHAHSRLFVAEANAGRLAPAERPGPPVVTRPSHPAPLAAGDSKVAVAAAKTRSGQGVAVRSYRKPEGAAIACVRDGAGRPALCVHNPHTPGAPLTAARALPR